MVGNIKITNKCVLPFINRVDSVLKVVKENGFTNYANDVKIIV